jgi:hypothetical protein
MPQKLSPQPHSKPGCVNLKERFGRRFKVALDESYHAERSQYRESEAPWLMMIPCQHGHICPWGGENLAACTRTAGPIAKRLKALPFATVAQDGSDGANVVFPVDHFAQVAALMRPRKRRHLSDEAKAKAIQNLVPFSKKASVAAVEASPEDRECARGAPVDV